MSQPTAFVTGPLSPEWGLALRITLGVMTKRSRESRELAQNFLDDAKVGRFTFPRGL
jgi:hypothetical protein